MSTAKVHRKREIFAEGAITPEFIASSIAGHATRTDIGAHAIFLGQVRADTIGGRTVRALEYTAYREMAEEAMVAIREEAFTRWPQLTCLHVHHSLGRVIAGAICFFVFASAAHRQQAREAVAFVTDEVKARLPIFGKEVLSDATHAWKKNT